jgi:hypothetical protein
MALLLPIAAAAQSKAQASTDQVTVAGCVAVQTDTAFGTTVRENADTATGLLLTKATNVARPAQVPSAVPGSRPSGSGSGTTPGAVGSSGRAPADAVAGMTYALAGPRVGEMKKLAGQRIEVIGTLDPETTPKPQPAGAARAAGEGRAQDRASGEQRVEPSPAPSAHPSANPVRITVTAFRTVAGTC